MTRTDVRRRGAAAVLAGLLPVAAACSTDHGGSGADPKSSASSSSTSEQNESAQPAGRTKASKPTSSPAAKGVICLPVDDATVRDIADGSSAPIRPVPGRSVAYRPRGTNGTYLVVMVFTGPGRAEPQMGVWAIKRSIEAAGHGPIQSIDRTARDVTSWPVARWIAEGDFRVSEARACTLV